MDESFQGANGQVDPISISSAVGCPGTDWRPSSWYRLATLVLAALAILALSAADAGATDDHDRRQPGLVTLTVNEIAGGRAGRDGAMRVRAATSSALSPRLINVLLIRPIHSIAHGLYWS